MRFGVDSVLVQWRFGGDPAVVRSPNEVAVMESNFKNDECRKEGGEQRNTGAERRVKAEEEKARE